MANNRLRNLFAPATPAEFVDRALVTLEFCEAIMRIHVQSGAVRSEELSGLTRLEMWASAVLRQNGYSC